MTRIQFLKTISLSVILTFAVGVHGSLNADDLDQKLLKSLEERVEPESVVTIVNRLLENTRQAQTRLAASDLQEETQALQDRILTDIDILLEMTSSPSESPRPSAGQANLPMADEQPGAEQSQQSEGQRADTQPSQKSSQSLDPNAASKESAERSAQADGTTSEQERRLGLATAVWGHLPPKVREQMQSAFSETYLPEYDELVRRYYEALAARRNRPESGDSE